VAELRRRCVAATSPAGVTIPDSPRRPKEGRLAACRLDHQADVRRPRQLHLFLALPELADAASKVDPARRVEFVRAAHAVAAATHGPSLVAMALMIGVPLLLLGIAMVLDRYPSWLGWTGLVIGGATMLAALGLFLIPSLFPGFLLYGVLGSVIAQLWLVATGIVMLRRARVAPDPATAAEGSLDNRGGCGSI
jgi:hypothetical protein